MSQTVHEDGVSRELWIHAVGGRAGRDTWEWTEKDVLKVKLTLALVAGWEKFCSRHRAVGVKQQRWENTRSILETARTKLGCREV